MENLIIKHTNTASKRSTSYESSDQEDSVSLSSDDVIHGQHEYNFMGDILDNKYAIFHKLGSGAYSSVWLAYEIETQTFCAFKIQYSQDYQEGLYEVNFLRKMSNMPHIINLIEAFIVVRQENQYICMKTNVCAGTLFDALHTVRHHQYREHPPGGRLQTKKYGLPLDMIQKITKQLLIGVNCIHQQGIIHTDLKPENILLAGYSETVRSVIDTFKKLNFQKIYLELREKYISEKNLDPSKEKHKKKLRKEKGNLYRATIQIIMSALINYNDDTSDESTLSINSQDAQYELFTDDENNDEDDEDNNDDDDDEDDEDDNDDDDDEDDDGDDGGDDDDDEDDDDDDDASTTSDTTDFITIEDKALKKCQVLITDFGTIVDIHHNDYEEIQTRHYRAPEVILGKKYTQTCDMWSIGCTLYELYTGKMLFNPDKSDTMSRDMCHLIDIHTIIGTFGKDMINKSPRKKEFIHMSLTSVNKNPTLDNLVGEAHHRGCQPELVLDFLDFLKSVLVIDGSERPSCQSMMKHRFVEKV